MTAIHYTQRLVDGFGMIVGNLETDVIDLMISGKRLTSKMQQVQEKMLRFQEQNLNLLIQWMESFLKDNQTINKLSLQQAHEKTKEVIDSRKKQLQKKLILHNLRSILKHKAKKMKSDLNTSYKSLNPNQISQEEDKMEKLNCSIRLVQKDLGIEEEPEEIHASYITHRTVQSIDKDYTLGNSSILSIQNIVRKHQFILDSEIKRQLPFEAQITKSVTTIHLKTQHSNEKPKQPSSTLKKPQKQQNSQSSNKNISSKPSLIKPSLSSKKTPLPPSKSSKQTARIQQIKDNLSKYRQDLQQQQKLPPVPVSVVPSKQVVFSSKSKGTFDDAIKQSYQSLINSQNTKK